MFPFLRGHVVFFSLGYMPRSGIAESRGNSVIGGLARLVTKAVAPFYGSRAASGGFDFSTFLFRLRLEVFDSSHPSGREVVSHVV